MLHALRQGIRHVINAHSFIPIAIVLLGIGMGMSIAAFSLIEAVLLRPLTYDKPESLFTIRMTDARGATLGASYLELQT